MKAKKMVCKNKVRYGILDRKEVVYVTTSGKYKVEFIVDKDLWIGFLDKYNWTAMSKFNKYYIKTSVKGTTKSIHTIIGERIFEEEDMWGKSIHHINVNNLDNRASNLKLVSHRINSMIQQNYESIKIYETKNICGNTQYMTRFMINGKIYHKTNTNKAIIEKFINDNIHNIFKSREKVIIELEKKERLYEFKRGLKSMIKNNEYNEVNEILKDLLGITIDNKYTL